jgi:hypothetical protein
MKIESSIIITKETDEGMREFVVGISGNVVFDYGQYDVVDFSFYPPYRNIELTKSEQNEAEDILVDEARFFYEPK